LNFPISLVEEDGWWCCRRKYSTQQQKTPAVRKICRLWNLARVGMPAELVEAVVRLETGKQVTIRSDSTKVADPKSDLVSSVHCPQQWTQTINLSAQ